MSVPHCALVFCPVSLTAVSVSFLSMQKASIHFVAEYNSAPCKNDMRCDFPHFLLELIKYTSNMSYEFCVKNTILPPN